MNGILYLNSCSFSERLALSHNIHQDVENIIVAFCKLVSDMSVKPRTKLIAPYDWYELANGDNVFNLVQSHPDPSVQMDILTRMNCITTITSQYIDKNQAKNNVTEKCDKDFYYGVFSDEVEWCGTLDAYQCVCSLQTLFDFHTHFLKFCPKSNDSYGARCNDIFVNLKFYDDFSDDLKSLGSGMTSGITHFSIPMTSCLKALNGYELVSRNMMYITRRLQADTGIDCCEEGGGKGAADRNLKPEVDVNGVQTDINCEYHFKPVRSNFDHVKWHGYNRLYFGLMPDGHEKKFYIHHVGHL